jgi:hypothetical protein
MLARSFPLAPRARFSSSSSTTLVTYAAFGAEGVVIAVATVRTGLGCCVSGWLEFALE